MSLIKKHRPNIIFGSIIILLFVFFFSPLWDNLYTYLLSLSLDPPNIEENLKSNENIYFDNNWKIYGIDESDIIINEINKPIFLNIFATWCTPCKSEFPSIIDLHNKFKNEIEFIIVSPDENLMTLKKFEDSYSFHLPFYTSKGVHPRNININSYPKTIVIDKDKKVLLEITGAHDWNSNNVVDFLNNLSKE